MDRRARQYTFLIRTRKRLPHQMRREKGYRHPKIMQTNHIIRIDKVISSCQHTYHLHRIQGIRAWARSGLLYDCFAS